MTSWEGGLASNIDIGGSYPRDILGALSPVTISSKAVSSKAVPPHPGASSQSGSWNPGTLGPWIQAGLGTHKAAAPKTPTWRQTVTSFLLAVRKCWGR